MVNLKKEDNENTNEYIWRMCDYKDKGLLDLNWEQVGELINKELFGSDEELYRTSSAYRKPYQYAKDFYDDVFKKRMYSDDNEAIKKMDDLKRDIQKERIKLNATKAEYNRNLRQQSRFELFYEDIRNNIDKIDVPKFEPRGDKNGNVEFLLTIADIHCGARFISENNSYSLEICKLRFDILLDYMIKFVTEKKIPHIHILELGDSIQGLLRINDLKVNESSVVEATIFVAKLLSNFLNELSKYCDIDYYHCPTSNHSQMRVLNAKASELASEDIEYIIGNYIKDTLANNEAINVHTSFGKEYIDFQINNFNIIAMHGHQIKNVSDSLKDLSQLRRIFYDFVFLAHYHAGREIIVGEDYSYDTEVNICPSFVGSDPYSDSILKGSKASCKIYGISAQGHTETYKVVLN